MGDRAVTTSMEVNLKKQRLFKEKQKPSRTVSAASGKNSQKKTTNSTGQERKSSTRSQSCCMPATTTKGPKNDHTLHFRSQDFKEKRKRSKEDER